MRLACQILSDPTWYVRIYPAAPPQPRLRVSVCPRRSRRCRVNSSAQPPVAAPLPWYAKNSQMAQTRPLPRICIALGFPELDRLMEHARREAEAGESFLEFRLDYLEDPERGAQAIRGFLEQYPDCIVLATCRRHQNRGKFNGSIEEEMRVLDVAVTAGGEAVDVEIESAEAAAAKLSLFRGRARLVVSYHNYEATPQLDTLLNRMTRIPADGYKIVTTARKPSDYGRVLALAKAHPRTPLIVLAMGELGFPSRVLSAAFGGMYTYAAPTATQGTAAGQVCARQLRHVYRVDKLSRSSKIYGVVDDPGGGGQVVRFGHIEVDIDRIQLRNGSEPIGLSAPHIVAHRDFHPADETADRSANGRPFAVQLRRFERRPGRSQAGLRLPETHAVAHRSEERRVGKECRSRGGP